jgi:transcriptional regulator with XRE-family HTH domain
MTELNKSIKEIRKELGWTQEEMANQIGVSISAVQRWEQINRHPSPLALKALGNAVKQAKRKRKPTT